MSKLAKIGWALAAFTILAMGVTVYLDKMSGLTSYALGVVLGAHWAWTLKGVK